MVKPRSRSTPSQTMHSSDRRLFDMLTEEKAAFVGKLAHHYRLDTETARSFVAHLDNGLTPFDSIMLELSRSSLFVLTPLRGGKMDLRVFHTAPPHEILPLIDTIITREFLEPYLIINADQKYAFALCDEVERNRTLKQLGLQP